MTSLEHDLHGLDGAGYGAYKKLHGRHNLDHGLILHIDKVQADPYAPPSLIQVELPLSATGLSSDLVDGNNYAPACDHLTRRVADALPRDIFIDTPGQQVLPRASVAIRESTVFVRLEASLPARGRRIRGHAAAHLICRDLPDAIRSSLLNLTPHDLDQLRNAVDSFVDQDYLRSQLAEAGLVAFIANGSVLPRAAGNSDRPMRGATTFQAPESLTRSFDLPRSQRTIHGLGIPAGVTLIVGGGYNGKSTVLRAIEDGVFNHVIGDGREFAVTVVDAAALRAEDGRAVSSVDVSPFIGDLPSGASTARFSTSNASGSTSQASSLVEALEAGASTLLIDEDTSATNFMIRDSRMRQLVPANKEPITPLVARVRELYDRHGVSTVLVAGGSGAFLDVADTVIMLDAYEPVDVTKHARELAEVVPERSIPAPFDLAEPRRVSLDLPKKPPQAKGLSSIRYGREFIDLAALSQLVDSSQTRAIATIIGTLARPKGSIALREHVDKLLDQARTEGVDTLSPHGHPGRLALPRRHEVMAAINRYRKLVSNES